MSPLDRRRSHQVRRRYLGHVLLHLDDLDDLLELLKSKCASVELKAQHATAEDGVSDLLSARPSELRDIAIVAQNPHVEVILADYAAFVFTNSRTPAANKVLDQVASLLAMRRKPFVAYSRDWVLWISTAAVVATMVPYAVTTGDPYAAFHMWIYAVPTGFMAIRDFLRSRRRGKARVIPQWLHENNALRSGTYRQIGLGFVGTVIGALATAVLGFVLVSLKIPQP